MPIRENWPCSNGLRNGLQKSSSGDRRFLSSKFLQTVTGLSKDHFFDKGTAWPDDLRCANSLVLDRKSFLQTAQAVELAAVASSSSTSLSSFLLRRFLPFAFFDVGFGSSAANADAASGAAFEAEAAVVAGLAVRKDIIAMNSQEDSVRHLGLRLKRYITIITIVFFDVCSTCHQMGSIDVIKLLLSTALSSSGVDKSRQH